jgi:hypothetical protein
MNTRRFVRLTPILFAVVIGCGGKSGHNDRGDGGSNTGDGGMGDGGMLPDNTPCTPNALRCNVNNVEQCNAAGTMWTVQQMCTTFCADNACALPGLDVRGAQSLDGIVHVQGAVDIHDGGMLSSPTGNLTIFAESITVESGGAIAVAATGMSPQGAGEAAGCPGCDPSGGNYSWVSQQDSDVFPGSPGGAAYDSTAAAAGGGVLQLFAATIDIAGQLTANGASGGPFVSPSGDYGGGGASGGGILLSGNSVTVTGAISTAGGPGGPSVSGLPFGQSGFPGGVKLLYGTGSNFGTATINGTQTTGLAPPVELASSSHPDPTLIYNDNFVSLDLNWKAPFAVQGYYMLLNTTPVSPPTAANGTFQGATQASFSANNVTQGANYVHIVSVDQQSNIGSIENNFEIQINKAPPHVSSTSHPDPTQFYNDVNPYFSWTYPQGSASVSGAYYVFDHFGNTIPTTTDTKLPATQQQLLLPNVGAGVWVLHVISADSQGRLTKVAGNYRVNIGANPGSGGISGHVVNASSQPVTGAVISVNNGLYTTTTDSNGNYSIATVTAGQWQLSATSGALTGAQTITVTAGMTVAGDLTVK